MRNITVVLLIFLATVSAYDEQKLSEHYTYQKYLEAPKKATCDGGVLLVERVKESLLMLQCKPPSKVCGRMITLVPSPSATRGSCGPNQYVYGYSQQDSNKPVDLWCTLMSPVPRKTKIVCEERQVSDEPHDSSQSRTQDNLFKRISAYFHNFNNYNSLDGKNTEGRSRKTWGKRRQTRAATHWSATRERLRKLRREYRRRKAERRRKAMERLRRLRKQRRTKELSSKISPAAFFRYNTKRPLPFQKLVQGIRHFEGGLSATFCSFICDDSDEDSDEDEIDQSSEQELPKSPEEKGEENGADSGEHRVPGHGNSQITCFAGETTVKTPFGTKYMHQLRLGDQVEVFDGISQQFEPIIWFHHFNPEAEAAFLTIQTYSNRSITISRNHLILFIDCDTYSIPDLIDLYGNFLFAARAKPGDCLVSRNLNGEYTVDAIRQVIDEKSTGIYAPITAQGTVIVNDIVASCYSTVENQYVQIALHSMYMKFWSVFQGGETYADCDNYSNIPYSLQLLLKMAETVIPGFVY